MMKKKLLYFAVIFLLVSCSNKKGGEQEKQAQDLQNEVLEIHDVTMPKSMKIPDLEKKVSRMLDSLNKLAGKAKEESAPLKAKLESLAGDLSYAYMAMDKWMTEFSLNKYKDSLADRIRYLTDEKMKAEKMKEAVLNSLAKADSLLK